MPTVADSLKIVRIIARLNVGGPARHVVWLTRELQGDDFKSVLLTGTVPAGEEDMNYFAAENGVEPIYIAQMSRELSPKDAISLWKIYRILRREKPDIIHTHTAKAGTIGRVAGFVYRWLTWKTLLGKPRPVRLVHTFHGHVFHSYYGASKTKIFLVIERVLARVATDKIVVISRQQLEEIAGKFRVGKKAKFRVVPLGIDLESFADWQSKRSVLREEIGADDDEILVGLIGRLTEVKNHSLFLQVAEIYEKNPGSVKLKFVVIGDGHLRESLEQEAEARGVKDTVIFVGNRNDADIFYAGLDIVALTSLNEGTPLSLIEAMASEKPIISTRVGGVADLLGEAVEAADEYRICERGISIRSDDQLGFYAGLRRLSDDAELRETLGAEGRIFVENEYGKARLVADIKRLYRELIEN